MTMPQREVKVGNHRYKFYLIGGLKAFQASRKFATKLATLIPSVWTKNNTDISQTITDLLMEDFDYLFDTFIDKNATYCDDQLILDFDEHFAGRFTEVPQLLYKVIMENDRDFFHSLPTLIEKLARKMEEKLPANSLPNQDKVTEAMDSIAQKVKENLG